MLDTARSVFRMCSRISACTKDVTASSAALQVVALRHNSVEQKQLSGVLGRLTGFAASRMDSRSISGLFSIWLNSGLRSITCA